ncbi:hypothetical protein [Vibrio harveyi]|uniref:hypothetical protein n=1 Tax=Vibrio harveyi TaxID=669 RepID=UPI0018F26704|nr:hypothetical protein [Vibrio harveyi]
MPFPQEPLNPALDPVDRIRLKIGDIDPYMIEFSYELYDYFLTDAGGDEGKATLTACKALIAKYSRACEEETDETKIKERERLQGLRELLKDLQLDVGNVQIYASGLSRCERVRDRLDNDMRDNTLTVGERSGMFSHPLKNAGRPFGTF